MFALHFKCNKKRFRLKTEMYLRLYVQVRRRTIVALGPDLCPELAILSVVLFLDTVYRVPCAPTYWPSRLE